MTKKEKFKFIEDLCNSIRDEAQGKIDKMPEDWDGIEIRQLIADKFKQEAFYFKDKRNSRYKDYINEVITKNL